MEKQSVVVLSGAGVSAESGIKTFRDADGLWEGHDVMEVATPDGWRRNRDLVLDFYNQRRRQLKEVLPNQAHFALVELEKQYDTHVVTQNVDDLHERAGSSQVVHLHGELMKARSSVDPRLVYDWPKDILPTDKCERGSQLRPHVVWFGEDVPMLTKAAALVAEAHHVIIVGTSMQVYPAAGLVGIAPTDAQIFYVDPKPTINYELSMIPNLTVIAEKATVGIRMVVDQLLEM
ncbi:SIR2 family NAD-dependent protein deacylase [Flavilitoribacter nigricans]|uniref:NAD-dependent protein deacylase n=1 Tax=Flavilitoribacter nigricans (strain ATCC 23147 / DSM 23189 / NBRC 102662 / NCIMB 1420 / SS-2) TaxID=1122177 RepID=A0A2D0NAX9_FLAN2|nr:NAD-dependent deacylase [Flavilitoribacter nigricans]PHN05672.1 NAD-dependent protein deacylase [Flavilitoribacter nigricans DSM 23189 = NBRC 102662]